MNSKIILPASAIMALLISSGCVPNAAQPAQASPVSTKAARVQTNAPVQVAAAPRQTIQTLPKRQVKKRTGDWRDWPISSGDWVYRQDGRGSIALFGKPSGEADFMIRCNKANRAIYFSRAGSTTRSGAQMTVRASSGLKSFAAHNSGGQPSYVASQLSPADTFLDKIAFSRGRFVVELAGHAELVIPIWPEFTRVVEDCRS